MNIAFWGNMPGRAAVSANIIATATYAALKYNMDIAVMQAKYDLNRIENAFMPMKSMIYLKEDFGYYKRQGIDEVIDGIKMNKEMASLEDVLVRIKNTSLCYLPSTSEVDREIFDRESEMAADDIYSMLNNTNRITFIDCGVGADFLSRKMIDEADLVITNLEQDLQAISKKMLENNGFMEKCLFLVGRYDSDSKYNIRSIRRKFRIDEECIAAIPYNVEFRDSVCEGKTIDFMNRNLDCALYEDNYEFIRGVDYATRMILRRVGCNV